LALVNLICKFQVVELVSTMDVPVSGAHHLQAGVLNMVASLLRLNAAHFQANSKMVVTSALVPSSKEQIIQL